MIRMRRTDYLRGEEDIHNIINADNLVDSLDPKKERPRFPGAFRTVQLTGLYQKKDNTRTLRCQEGGPQAISRRRCHEVHGYSGSGSRTHICAFDRDLFYQLNYPGVPTLYTIEPLVLFPIGKPTASKVGWI